MAVQASRVGLEQGNFVASGRLSVRRDVGDVVGPVWERMVPWVTACIWVFDRHPSWLRSSCRGQTRVATAETGLVRREEETRLERELASDAAILVEGLKQEVCEQGRHCEY